MSRPADIPIDVWDEAFETAIAVGAGRAIGATETIARAILAGRRHHHQSRIDNSASRPEDIPEDVWQAAFDTFWQPTEGSRVRITNQHAIAKTILADRQRLAHQVGVKPLEWDEYYSGPDLRGGEIALASSIIGRYQVYGDGAWSDPGHEFHNPGAERGLAVAKAAAEAHYQTRIRSALQSPAPTHRHVARGSDYALLGFGRIKSEHWRAEYQGGNYVDMREVALYRAVADGSLWARPREEFEDGRFVALSPGDPS